MKNHLILCFIFGLIGFKFGFTQSPITAEDLYQIKNITDIAISPDGKMLAFVVETMDKPGNCYRSSIWMMDTKTRQSRQLTGEQTGYNRAPFWSPDSRYLGFISNRSGSHQIWLIDIGGGEAWTMTRMEHGVNQAAWSPDGKNIVFISRTEEKPAIDPHQPKGDIFIDTKGREFAKDVKVINRLRYREGTHFTGNSYSHIFIIPVSGGNPQQITSGQFDDTQPRWSPNSNLILFQSNRFGEHDFDNNLDLCLVDLFDKKVKILTNNPGSDYSAEWSPDGQKLAYLTTGQVNNFREQTELNIFELPNKITLKNLTTRYDRTIRSPQWSPKGKNIYFLAHDQGNRHLYIVSLKKQEPILVCGGDREIKQFCISPDEKKIYFIATNPLDPSNLFEFDLKKNQEIRLTSTNEDFFKNRILSQPETVWYPSADGLKIQGWLLKPVNLMPDETAPLITEIHGGPFWCYGNRWEFEFQLLAAQGFGVFFCNPRTSIGYGQSFAAKTPGEWGAADQADILHGIAHVSQMAWIDSLRLGVTGGSYGGFMTTYIIGHSTKFRAAVTQRSLSNLFSFYGTTDIQNLIESEFGEPTTQFQQITAHSPIMYADKIKTPLLILHSECDYRVPISQAEELFVHLKRKGADVEFVRYPDEGHELPRSGQPQHRVDRLNRILTWFERYLK